MVWLYLTTAIATEIAGTIALRFAHGFTRPLPTTIVVVGYALSFLFLSLTLRSLSVSVTYAIWSGAGTAAIAIVGAAALGEPMTALKAGSVALIVAGVVGLNAAGGH
jgi:small multidrug resistance pump